MEVDEYDHEYVQELLDEGSEYTKWGFLFAIPTSIATCVACIWHAVVEWDWFIGLPAGAAIGIFFGAIAGGITIYTWPVVLFGAWYYWKHMM